MEPSHRASVSLTGELTFMAVHHVSEIQLDATQILFYFILTTVLQDCYQYAHFMDEQRETKEPNIRAMVN